MIDGALTTLLATLVDVPSITGDEAAIAALVAGRLERRPGAVLRSGNAVVWRGPGRDRPLVVLAGHLDTVPADGNARAHIADGHLYGRGASDMKSGLAVMLTLVETLDPDALRFDLAAVFYDAEEGPSAQNGLERVLRAMPWLPQARLAVLLEPTACAVEAGCNGVLNVEVEVTGRAAHSARPWTGMNAVERAAPWLAAIVREPVRSVVVQGLEFRETLQLTTLRAGHTRNVVPDRLVANLNHRFAPGVTPEQAEARVRALVPPEFGCTVVDRAPAALPALDRDEVRDLVARTGMPPAAKQGWTDVARLAALGVAAVNLGPGLPEACHTPDESCPLANLARVHDVLAGFLRGSPR
jgi:succinyl-diaminopimelate desuccinylase